MTEEVVLVNNNDEVIGVEEKLATHLRGALHRAFSIFIFTRHSAILLQCGASLTVAFRLRNGK